MEEIEVRFEDLIELSSRHRTLADVYAALTRADVTVDGSGSETAAALEGLNGRLQGAFVELATAHGDVAASLTAGAHHYERLERP
jgi:hypothetical protein